MPWLARAIFAFSDLGNSPCRRLPERHTLVGEPDHLLSPEWAGLHLEPRARSLPISRCSPEGPGWLGGRTLPAFAFN